TPPMGYLEEGEAKGFGVEITRAVLDEAGIEHHFKMVPWVRAYEEAKRGNGFIFGMFWSGERAELFEFSEPLWTEHFILVTRAGEEFSFQSMQDLKGKRVALQRVNKLSAEFTAAVNAELFTSIEIRDAESRLRFLMAGRADAAIFSPGVAALQWSANLAGVDVAAVSVLAQPVAYKAKHLGVAKSQQRPELILKINAAIKKLRENGTLEAIKKRYGST
ncbi:MAG: substrate-binding periplasmic protein, partial [Pseudomonadales bacterium]